MKKCNYKQAIFITSAMLICGCNLFDDIEIHDLPGGEEDRPEIGGGSSQDTISNDSTTVEIIPIKYYEAFREGTQWVTEYGSIYTPDIDIETMTIEGESIIAGRCCMNLYRSWNGGGNSLYAYLYTEEDRVYFIKPDDLTQAYLFYDFGIEPGEESQVVPIIDWKYECWLEYPFYQTLIKEYTISNCGHQYNALRLEEYEAAYGFDAGLGVKHEWIKGIGSTLGLLQNCGRLFVGGGFYKLIKVVVDGETIYEVESESSNDIQMQNEDTEPDMQFDLLGRPLPSSSEQLFRIPLRRR